MHRRDHYRERRDVRWQNDAVAISVLLDGGFENALGPVEHGCVHQAQRLPIGDRRVALGHLPQVRECSGEVLFPGVTFRR